MPQLNRDKESLYAPGKLSLWFLATSGVLFACLVWMLWADYDRPWKKIQKDYFRRQAGLQEVAASIERDKVLSDDNETSQKQKAKLAAISKRIEAAKRALEAPEVAAEIAALDAEIVEQDAQLLEADTKIKSLKGKFSELRFNYEMALKDKKEGHGDDAKIKDLTEGINDIAAQQYVWEAKRRGPFGSLGKAKDRLAAIRSDLRDAEGKRDEILKPTTDLLNQQEASVAATEKNQWRNMPMADIVAPSITIDKAVLQYIHDDYNFATTPKVDMCMTCHRGIDRALMTEGKVRELLRGHLKRTFGTTAWDAVGGGLGAETKDDYGVESIDWSGAVPALKDGAFKPWISSPSASLDDLFSKVALAKALDAKTLKSVEGQDLLAPFRLEAVQWAHPHLEQILGATSWHKMEKTGCTVCHHGRGMSTDFRTAAHDPNVSGHAAAHEIHALETEIAALKTSLAPPGAKVEKPKDEKDAEARATEVAAVEAEIRAKAAKLEALRQEENWAKKYGWKTPELIDFPMLPLRYVEGQCLKCHLPALTYPAVPETLDHPTKKKDSDPANKPVVNAPAPKPVDGHASAIDKQWHPEKLERGVKAMREWGCVGCHRVSDFTVAPGFPVGDPNKIADAKFPAGSPKAYGDPLSTPTQGSLSWAGTRFPKVGPDLTHLADKTTIEWAKRWIENPTAFKIDTRMPAFYRYRLHDDHYRAVLGADGKPVDANVVFSAPEDLPRDEAQIDVEVAALSAFLFDASQSKPLEGGYPQVPEGGDAKRGAKLFYGQNCWGCHVGPGKYDDTGTLQPDDEKRFASRTELPPGPRLSGLGSKVKAEWLFEWLREPHRYWPTTRMPNNRIRDEMAADNKTVVRSEALLRADLVAYLMASKSPEFDARPVVDPEKGVRWTSDHVRLLNDMWLTYYGKGDPKIYPLGAQATAEAAESFTATRPPATKLIEVGKRLIGQRGCFGCHNVTGYESDQPIGKDLSAEGSQDIHKFDFGILGHEVPHTRWDWIDTKLQQPRIYDKGRFKPWTDRLRMPKFNFTAVDREAVVSTVLGLVKEPIQREALYRPTPEIQRLAAGRAVIERYNCNQCHTIEGRVGMLTKEQLAEQKELWMLPPNLYGEGGRVNADWLFRFVKNPDFRKDPQDVRPSVIQRMPWFHLSDEEARALVDYFLTLAGRTNAQWTDSEGGPLDTSPYAEPVTITIDDPVHKGSKKTMVVKSRVEEAKALFDTANCVKCHLRKGTPGADPAEGASAPPFVLAHDRLRREWVFSLLHDPETQINGTKMPAFWPLRGAKSKPKDGGWRKLDYPEFQFDTRGNPKATNDDVAEAQMNALARYLLYHFEEPRVESSAPPTPPAPPTPAESGVGTGAGK